MIGLKQSNEILNYLENLIPEPRCELDYDKDYELLIAVMLSAQTTDKRVNVVTNKMFNKYKTLKELKEADINEITNLVRELGNYEKKSKAVIEIAKEIDKIGHVPNNREYLENLPMVGRKTVSVVLSELYNEPNIAVDTHVLRVSKRLNITEEKDDALKTEEKLKQIIPKTKWCEAHLRLVLFGRYYCTAKNPSCSNCMLKKHCNYCKNM